MAKSCVPVNGMLFLFYLTILAVDGVLPPKFFDVMKYGAVAGEKNDNTLAFLNTWKDACAYEGRSVFWIPKGTYYLGSISFIGPCKGSMAFLIKGTLKAHTDNFFTGNWIRFRYLSDLTVAGGGYLDGQGHAAWNYNDCHENRNCKPLPVTMRFDFITNSRIHHLHSINSKNSHFNIFASQNLNIGHIRITAPENSPNTDGIHIGDSSQIRISDAIIATGDDCISMVAGSHDINISNVACGPGHGISIGSLGGGLSEGYVSNISVKNCSFTGTQNGVRIKTWSPSSYSLASGITFENIFMENVNNPIVIDQKYCPFPTGCSLLPNSGVQIKDVTYKNIYGISNTKVALSLECSGVVPCKNVKLININLAYKGKGGPVTSKCSNVIGSSYGKQTPGRCV